MNQSMHQGKLEVVKQEMLRVNIDILGISKLRWTAQMTILSTTMNISTTTLEEME